MLKKVTTAGAVLGSAVAIAAGPAAAASATTDYAGYVTQIGRYAKWVNGGVAVGVHVTYYCDPANTDRPTVYVTFRQVINGRAYSASKYFYSSYYCTGYPRMETIRVFPDNGEPAWRLGQGLVSVKVYTNNDGYGQQKSRTVYVRR